MISQISWLKLQSSAVSEPKTQLAWRTFKSTHAGFGPVSVIPGISASARKLSSVSFVSSFPSPVSVAYMAFAKAFVTRTTYRSSITGKEIKEISLAPCDRRRRPFLSFYLNERGSVPVDIRPQRNGNAKRPGGEKPVQLLRWTLCLHCSSFKWARSETTSLATTAIKRRRDSRVRAGKHTKRNK